MSRLLDKLCSFPFYLGNKSVGYNYKLAFGIVITFWVVTLMLGHSWWVFAAIHSVATGVFAYFIYIQNAKPNTMILSVVLAFCSVFFATVILFFAIVIATAVAIFS